MPPRFVKKRINSLPLNIDQLNILQAHNLVMSPPPLVPGIIVDNLKFCISLLKVLLLRRDDYGSCFKFIRTLLIVRKYIIHVV
ncbi:hypothetical protein PNOK_0136100 [Pyrrhoderma noxium]|uniref:Uncharacterized protein n=1 Tax=Pyrrhoderma noxium TaxID=2282107 RepID=A0A286UXF6_9AGAM|nr:hypothetical protein PNOK_0136100 [Pyrrhoderma noxium]